MMKLIKSNSDNKVERKQLIIAIKPAGNNHSPLPLSSLRVIPEQPELNELKIKKRGAI